MKTIAFLLFAPIAAQATLTPSSPRGEQVIQIADRDSLEICVIPTHLPFIDYTKKDLANEQGLCALQADVNAAICPKTVSTNPAVEWFEVPAGISVAQAEANACSIADPKDRTKNVLKKLAKYKNSTSCSYTPSILAYYHVSRILNGAGHVPPAVLRTLDVSRHEEIAELGISEATRKLGAAAVIVKTWQSLLNFLSAGPNTSKRDILFTDDFRQSYGALQVNPRNEIKYAAMFNKETPGGTRAEAFRDSNTVFQLVKSSYPLSSLVGNAFTQANVQTVEQMKDSGDLAVIDTILSQEDRFGNVHAEERYAYRSFQEVGANGLPKVKFESKLTPQEVAAKGAVLVKQMLLKDNDCGIVRINRAAKAGLLNAVAHMDPNTYQGVLYFDSIADQPEVVRSFRSGMMFTAADYSLMRANLRSAAALLKSRCMSNALKLDLDVDVAFSGQPAGPNRCYLQTPTPKLNVDMSALQNSGVQ